MSKKIKSEKIKLFVDDIRNPEHLGLEGWTIARTSKRAIAILSQGNVVECSLDHDLGGDDTGYKVICWMENNGVIPENGISCHSSNPVGREKINMVIRKISNML